MTLGHEPFAEFTSVPRPWLHTSRHACQMDNIAERGVWGRRFASRNRGPERREEAAGQGRDRLVLTEAHGNQRAERPAP